MRLKSREFKDFIHKSKLKLENSLSKMESVFYPHTIKGFNGCSLKTVRVLASLTNNGGIIWSKERKNRFKGIILEHPKLSGFKLVMQLEDKVYSLKVYQRDNKLIEECCLNLKKDEYWWHLIESIERRIVIEHN